MHRDIVNTIWHHSADVAHAWIMFFGTKQSWLSSFMTFMLQMKKEMSLKPGLFTVRVENYRKYRPYYKGSFGSLFFFSKTFLQKFTGKSVE